MSVSLLQEIHDRLVGLARRQGELDRELGVALVEVFRNEVPRAFGYASFREYAERMLGWSGRHAEEKLRVALALEKLPRLGSALSDGTLNWSAVREISRVAVPETEEDWISEMQGKTVREIERAVAGCIPGDLPC